MNISSVKSFLISTFVFVILFQVVFTAQTKNSQLKNLSAFAKLYGYVKYFHPSDEAAELDWDKFAVFGVAKIKDAQTDDELKELLKKLFMPIAPTIQIYSLNEKLINRKEINPTETTGLEPVFWQHFGVGLSSESPLYRSVRINKMNFVNDRFQANTPGIIVQSISALPYRGKRIRLSAYTMTSVELTGQGQLWLRVDREKNQQGFFDNMNDRPMKNEKWNEFEINGDVAEDAERIVFGCFLSGSGRLWIDKVRLSYSDDGEKWIDISIENAGFDEKDNSSKIKSWRADSPGYKYELDSEIKYEGNSSLLISKESTKNKQFISATIFNEAPKIGELINKEISDGLYCSIPLVLFTNKQKTLGSFENDNYSELVKSINAIDFKILNGNDENVRLADVIIAWNVFQHFYPYFEVVKVDWSQILGETLGSAIQNKTADEFYKTLSRMVAKLEDGHGYVYCSLQNPNGGLPIRVDFIEEKLVVTGTDDKEKFQIGDVILKIDGKDAIQELINEEQFVSGSPQLKRYRTLNQYGYGDVGSIAKIELLRNNSVLQIQYERKKETRGFFFNHISKFDFPAIKKLSENIYYINLTSASNKDFMDSINVFAKAKGVIFDTRWNGKSDSGLKRINEVDLLTYLANEPFQSAYWNIPQVIYPDREKMTFLVSRWPAQDPKEPHFKGTVVYIVDPPVVSYGESVMGIVEHYKLGEIVGGLTAGTNGNVNFINLVGGYRIMWTGMKVIKHDGTQHHLIGIKPTFPVKRTLKAIQENRDEYLEKAIEVINSK